MKQKNFYEMLSVTKKSTVEEIKTNYRNLAKKYHPDTNIDDKEAEEIFKALNEAYDTLTNKEKKKKYDRQVARYGYGNITRMNDEAKGEFKYEVQSKGDIVGEIFNSILGFGKDAKDKMISTADDIKEVMAKRKEPKKGDNIETSIEVTLEEGFFGAEKKLSLKTVKGGVKNYSVNVPRGIRDNEKIRLAYLGKPGKNGGKNGDLIITVKMKPHATLKLDGADIHHNLDVTYVQAVIGDKIHMKILGEMLDINIPKGTKTGDKIMIHGKGYIVNETTRGALIINTSVKMPEELSEREQKIYEQLLKVEKQNMKAKLEGKSKK